MDIINKSAIGNHFKKENIYLGTIKGGKQSLSPELKANFKNIPEELLELLLKSGILSTQEFDVFYKSEIGYTRFLEEGCETFKGDNSDGKGFIENVVPAWEYFKEDELIEGIVNGNLIIIAKAIEPFERYNEDYNLKTPKRTLVPNNRK